MKRTQAVKHYAKMFLNSVGMDAVPKALEELSVVNGLMQKSSEFRGLLENPRFTGEEREKGLKELSARVKLSGNTVKLILYLSEHLVIASLDGLIQIVTAMYLEKKKKAKAVVEMFQREAELNLKYETTGGEWGQFVKRSPFFVKRYGEKAYQLVRGVKKVFDPNNILNPNILPEE